MSDMSSMFAESGGVRYSCEVVLLVTEYCGFVCILFASWCSSSLFVFSFGAGVFVSCDLIMFVVSSCCVICGAGMIDMRFACSLSSFSFSNCMALYCACLSCSLLSVSRKMTWGLVKFGVSSLSACILVTALSILRVDLLDMKFNFPVLVC